MPHTHVSRQLTVLATDDRVRIIDPQKPTEVLGEHRRSFDRDQRIELEGHVRALVEEKKRAHQSRGFDRLFSAAPSTRTMIEKLAERGSNLGAATSGLRPHLAGIGLFKAVADFDWKWPRKIDRALIEELFTPSSSRRAQTSYF